MSADVSDHMLRVRPVRDVSQVKALVAAAAVDHHTVIAPTEIVWRGTEIVGYGSLGGAPMMHVWLDSKSVRPRESIALLATGETLLARHGHHSVIVPCWDGSPFAPHMERLGYTKLGTTTLYTKNL